MFPLKTLYTVKPDFWNPRFLQPPDGSSQKFWFCFNQSNTIYKVSIFQTDFRFHWRFEKSGCQCNFKTEQINTGPFFYHLSNVFFSLLKQWSMAPFERDGCSSFTKWTVISDLYQLLLSLNGNTIELIE